MSDVLLSFLYRSERQPSSCRRAPKVWLGPDSANCPRDVFRSKAEQPTEHREQRGCGWQLASLEAIDQDCLEVLGVQAASGGAPSHLCDLIFGHLLRAIPVYSLIVS